jgi:hypothetical protein
MYSGSMGKPCTCMVWRLLVYGAVGGYGTPEWARR